MDLAPPLGDLALMLGDLAPSLGDLAPPLGGAHGAGVENNGEEEGVGVCGLLCA